MRKIHTGKAKGASAGKPADALSLWALPTGSAALALAQPVELFGPLLEGAAGGGALLGGGGQFPVQ